MPGLTFAKWFIRRAFEFKHPVRPHRKLRRVPQPISSVLSSCVFFTSLAVKGELTAWNAAPPAMTKMSVTIWTEANLRLLGTSNNFRQISLLIISSMRTSKIQNGCQGFPLDFGHSEVSFNEKKVVTENGRSCKSNALTVTNCSANCSYHNL